ncbi:MAG: hypothetical protein ACK5KL_17680 [Dysgonomonas sp.]
MKASNILLSASILLSIFLSCTNKTEKTYYLDGEGISKEALSNYLDRSITMVYFLMPDKPEGRRTYPYHEDDIRMVKDLKAKFIGRSIYRWGGESLLNSEAFWKKAKTLINEMHSFDSEMIFQACIFEVITQDVDSVKIPDWVFHDFNLPVENRHFSYMDMLNDEGKLVDHWRNGSSVPDVSKLETQLWFYYLAGSYISLGCEAIHIGQVGLIGMNDPELESWDKTLKKIRKYAQKNARRNWVLIDAHVPTGGMIKDGISLLDFNSFPLRIKEIPEKPYEGKLEVGYQDAIYTKSKGCISPSGWECEHLPYLVEFDNYGRGKDANIADHESHYVWGWDEISWLSLQPEEYRNEWIKYAYNWLKDTDSAGHLEMPGFRMITCPNETENSYRANTKSEDCPFGYSQEETIKKLWTSD